MLARLVSFARREKRDDDFREELNAHLQLATDEYLRRGLNADEARRKALIDFGGVVAAEELHREVRGLAGVESVEVDAGTVQDAVIALAKAHRPVGARIFNCEGELRNVVKVEVNGESTPASAATRTTLKDGDVVRLSFP